MLDLWGQFRLVILISLVKFLYTAFLQKKSKFQKRKKKSFPAELFDLVPLILSLLNTAFSFVWTHKEEHFQVSYEERKSHFKGVPNITGT